MLRPDFRLIVEGLIDKANCEGYANGCLTSISKAELEYLNSRCEFEYLAAKVSTKYGMVDIAIEWKH